jgi:hypothetical protein
LDTPTEQRCPQRGRPAAAGDRASVPLPPYAGGLTAEARTAQLPNTSWTTKDQSDPLPTNNASECSGLQEFAQVHSIADRARDERCECDVGVPALEAPELNRAEPNAFGCGLLRQTPGLPQAPCLEGHFPLRLAQRLHNLRPLLRL